MSAIADDVIDDNRTVVLRIIQNPSVYAVGSTSTCGAAANAEITWTISDDDFDLAVTKSVDDATPAVGSDITYTVSYFNNTASPTIAPLGVHHAVVAFADVVPAGMTFVSWTCTGTAGAVCPAASGVGPISGVALLRAGAGAAGGRLTYTVTARLNDPANCNAVTNTATIGRQSGTGEGTTAAADFTTPPPGQLANNTASTDVQIVCVGLSITKSSGGNSVRSGDPVVYTLHVANAGPGAADGSIVTDPPVPGVDCSTGTLTCGGVTGGAACPAGPTVAQLQGAGVTLPTLPAGSALDLTLACTVTATGQ